MYRFNIKEHFIIPAAIFMALASLATSMMLSHGLQSRILDVQETKALRRQFSLLSDAMRKAEASQRLFVITGETAHGAPVDAVEAGLTERWNSIRKYAEKQPEWKELSTVIAELEDRVVDVFISLRATMEVRKLSGRDAALDVVQAGATHAKLATLYEQLSVILEDLEEKLQEQSRDMMRAERWGHSGTLAAGVVAILLAALGLWQWRRSLIHRQREIELATDKERAEQMAEDKGAFLAVMSHEVRTPLNSMVGLSEALVEGLPNGVQRQQAESVYQAAKNLLRLVNEQLDLSRMEAGRLQLMREPIQLASFVEGLETFLSPQAAASGVAFQVILDSKLPESIMGDEGRLRQILINLVGNALKFTDRGGIVSLRVERERVMAGEMLVLEIKDNGHGIPLHLQTVVFEPYVRVCPAANLNQPGTGLGLAIVRQLVNLMGGGISLQSQPGSGATFRVTLPLTPAVDHHSERETQAALSTKGEIVSGIEPDEMQPLTQHAAHKLREILRTSHATASATQSSADVIVLVNQLDALGKSEGNAHLCRVAADIRQAAASFSLATLGKALEVLPQQLAPLTSSK